MRFTSTQIILSLVGSIVSLSLVFCPGCDFRDKGHLCAPFKMVGRERDDREVEVYFVASNRVTDMWQFRYYDPRVCDSRKVDVMKLVEGHGGNAKLYEGKMETERFCVLWKQLVQLGVLDITNTVAINDSEYVGFYSSDRNTINFFTVTNLSQQSAASCRKMISAIDEVSTNIQWELLGESDVQAASIRWYGVVQNWRRLQISYPSKFPIKH